MNTNDNSEIGVYAQSCVDHNKQRKAAKTAGPVITQEMNWLNEQGPTGGVAGATTENTVSAYVQFKLEGVTYDEVTGMFSMQVEQKLLNEGDWEFIAHSFGLSNVPEQLRDGMCRLVLKHAIAEQLAERIKAAH